MNIRLTRLNDILRLDRKNRYQEKIVWNSALLVNALTLTLTLISRHVNSLNR